jgi:ABC-2 type transport system ATP-binding protein
MDQLRAEAARGRTIVLTTQILSEAEELCDDILIMHRGRQIARGDLHALKLLSNGMKEVAITFDRMPDGLEADLHALQPLHLRMRDNTVELGVRMPDAELLALVGRLAARGSVLHVELGGATLEDVFVELTTR